MHGNGTRKRINIEKQKRHDGTWTEQDQLDKEIRDHVNVAVKTINRKKFFDARREK
jgi:hypothetical protein